MKKKTIAIICVVVVVVALLAVFVLPGAGKTSDDTFAVTDTTTLAEVYQHYVPEQFEQLSADVQAQYEAFVLRDELDDDDIDTLLDALESGADMEDFASSSGFIYSADAGSAAQ